jgi:outer membrane protein OmpA-like peptidoglycan-associated protein
MSVNTDSIEEVELRNQLIAEEVSIIPGKEYILTVSKVDFQTKEEDEIIVPLTRKIKYDFTSNPVSEEVYKESLERFIAGQEDIETIDGEIIDINILSKALQIREGDEVSFSLLPVKDLNKKKGTPEAMVKSSLYLDNKIVEFTHIQKYTINVPLKQQGKMNLHTDIEHIQENFSPGTFTLDIDTISFFSEITVDTTGYGDRVMKEEDVIDDPVFDVVVINFDLNEHKLRPGVIKTIQEKVIDELRGDERLYVTIKGYTDGLGNADYNFNLSKNRAESVKDFLTKHGIGDNRIRTFSFGESQALQEGIRWEDLSEEELEKHRKVEIVIYLPD